MTLSLSISIRLPRLNLTDPVTASFAPNYHYKALFCSIFFRPGSKSVRLVFAALSRRNHKAFQPLPSLHRATKPALYPDFPRRKSNLP